MSMDPTAEKTSADHLISARRRGLGVYKSPLIAISSCRATEGAGTNGAKIAASLKRKSLRRNTRDSFIL